MPQFVSGPAEFANTTRAGDQVDPQVAVLSDGGCVVAWTSPSGVYAQRYDAAGEPVAGELALHDGGHAEGAVATETGGFVLAVSDPQHFVALALRLDGAGQPVGDPIVLASWPTPTYWMQVGVADIDARPDGGFLATSSIYNPRPPGPSATIDTQAFDAAGVAATDPVHVGYGNGVSTSVGADGGWITTWWMPSYGPTVPWSLNEYSASGDLLQSLSLGPAAHGALDDGHYVLAWVVADAVASHFQLQIRAAGAGPAGPMLDFVAGDEAPPGGTAPRITPLRDGGFLLSFQVTAPGSDPYSPTLRVLGQYFDAAGQASGETFELAPRVSTVEGTGEAGYSITATADGGFVAVFEVATATTGEDVQVRKFSAVIAPPAECDAVAPSAIDFFPAAGSNSLPPDWCLAITFDEAVQAGAGTITLRTADGQVVQTFDAAGDPGIRFIDRSVVIDPADDLLPGTTYQLDVTPGAIQDLAGNASAGVSGHSFTTAGEPPAGGDPGAPVAVDFFPAAGSDMLPPDWSLGITFDEAVQAGAGAITLRTADGQVVQAFDAASDPGIRFIDRSVVIDPAADLLPGTSYQLVVAPGAIQDLAGNAWAGVSGYGFTTAGSALPPEPDATPPAAIDFFPADGSNTLPPDWCLGITFDEAVQAGGGTIVLQTAAGQVVQTFATAGDPGIRFSGAAVIVDPAADLLPGTAYELVVGNDAIEDLAGNAYAGVSGYGFTTAGAQVATLVGTADHVPA